MPLSKLSKRFLDRRRKVRTAPVRKSGVPRTRKALKEFTDSRIDANAQPHLVNYHEPRTQYNNKPDATGDVRPILPGTIQVGTTLTGGGKQTATVESRSGNQIEVTGLRVRGLIAIPPEDSSLEPDRALLYCRLICFSCKRFKTHQSIVDDWLTGVNLHNKLLMDGATAKPWEGTLSDMYLPLNTQLFTRHYEKRFFLARGVVQTLSAGSDGRGATHVPALHRSFAFSLKVKNKKLLYVDPVNSYPANFGPAMILIWAYANGAPATAAAVPFMSYISTLTWKQ